MTPSERDTCEKHAHRSDTRTETERGRAPGERVVSRLNRRDDGGGRGSGRGARDASRCGSPGRGSAVAGLPTIAARGRRASSTGVCRALRRAGPGCVARASSCRTGARSPTAGTEKSSSDRRGACARKAEREHQTGAARVVASPLMAVTIDIACCLPPDTPNRTTPIRILLLGVMHILLIGANVNPSSHHHLVCDPRPPRDPAVVDLRASAAHDGGRCTSSGRAQRATSTPSRSASWRPGWPRQRSCGTATASAPSTRSPTTGSAALREWLAEEPAASASRVGGGAPPPLRQLRHEGRPARGDPSASRRTRTNRSPSSATWATSTPAARGRFPTASTSTPCSSRSMVEQASDARLRWATWATEEVDAGTTRRRRTSSGRRTALRRVDRRGRAAQRRDLTARSICRFASRSARSRRLSIRSLPRATAISTFTRPSLK